MKRFCPFLLLIILSSVAYTQSAREKTRIAGEIRAVLTAQVEAWNRGDIPGFMNGYKRSDDLLFVSGDNVTRGWRQTLERYQRTYGGKEKMGVLSFSDLEFLILSKNAAVVIGSWSLQRSGDRPHGKFSLVFQRFKSGWRIILDHTS